MCEQSEELTDGLLSLSSLPLHGAWLSGAESTVQSNGQQSNTSSVHSSLAARSSHQSTSAGMQHIHTGVCLSAHVSVLVVLQTEPYLTFGVGRLLHLPSTEAVSVRPNAQPRCNHKVTVISCEAEIGCEAEKSPATWDWVTCSMIVPIMRSALS